MREVTHEPHRCLRLPLRREHRTHRRLRRRRGGPQGPPGRGPFGGLQVHVLRPRSGLGQEGDRGAQPHRRRGRRLLAAHAREDLPPRLRPGGAQQVHVRDGQHPRALLLDPRGPRRCHGQGHRHRSHHHREGQAQPPARGHQDPGDQARHGHRRRHRRHPGGTRYRRRRPRGRPGREGGVHRRPHEPAERDVPHPRLLPVHPHPPHGRGLPAPEHQALHLERGGEGRRVHRQLRGDGAQEGTVRRPGSLQRLRRLLGGVPVQEDPQRVRCRPQQPDRDLRTVPPGGAQPARARP
ncbi:MAG: hypothetical protein BWY94_02052 [Actinobacteria bacterium ADurb.BinA094]|nr:MAG: hypothetical protein BWY94_02052 [Actinobacteria bacterium ADurb.BinA094]